MRRSLVVGALMVGTVSIVLSIANAASSRPGGQPKEHAMLPSQNVSSGCETKIDGQSAHMEVGQSLAVGMTWRTCQLYDGHPVVIYSNELPRHADTE